MKQSFLPGKSSGWKQWAAAIGGALFGGIGGFISLFFGFAVAYQKLPTDVATWIYLSVCYVPLVIWFGVWGVLAYISRREASFRFFSGGIIGVMLFLLIHGLCFARLKFAP